MRGHMVIRLKLLDDMASNELAADRMGRTFAEYQHGSLLTLEGRHTRRSIPAYKY